MSNPLKKKLLLVSEDADPAAWEALKAGESEVQSWLAVAQDLWGAGCYRPGQRESIRQGANGLTMTKKHIIGAAGFALGGVGVVAGELAAYVDIFEASADVLSQPQQTKMLKAAGWQPQQPDFKSDRYHGFLAIGTIAQGVAPETVVNALAGALKGGGQIYVDELHAADPSAGALVAQAIACPSERLVLHQQDATRRALTEAGLQQRSIMDAAPALMDAIRSGLTRGQDIARLLKALPEAVRKQRLVAFTNELQRAAVLFQALHKGLVTATRSIHVKPRKI